MLSLSFDRLRTSRAGPILVSPSTSLRTSFVEPQAQGERQRMAESGFGFLAHYFHASDCGEEMEEEEKKDKAQLGAAILSGERDPVYPWIYPLNISVSAFPGNSPVRAGPGTPVKAVYCSISRRNWKSGRTYA